MKSIERENIYRKKKGFACRASARRVSKVTLARKSAGFLLITPFVLQHKKVTKPLKFRAKFVGCCTLYMNDTATCIPSDGVRGFWSVLSMLHVT